MFDVIAGAAVFAGGICLAELFRCKVEKALPLVVCAIVLAVYGAGLFGHLEIGFALAAAALAACVALTVYRCRKIDWRRVLTWGGGFYWVTVVLAMLQNRFKAVTLWDELGQWALSVKYSYLTNKLAAAAGTFSYYEDYPPGSSLFHFFWMKVGTGFVEERMYTSMAVLLAVFLIPVLAELPGKTHRLRSLLCCLALYLAPLTFFSSLGGTYKYLPVDGLVGVCFAYLLYEELYEKDPTLKAVSLAFGIFFLTLLKSSAILFALVVVCMAALRARAEAGSFAALWRQKAKCHPVMLACSCALSKLSWMLCLRKEHTHEAWGGLRADRALSHQMLDYQKQGLLRYIQAIFDYRVTPSTSQTEFFMSGARVSLIVWILLLLLMLVLLLWANNPPKADRIAYAVLFAGLFVYICLTSVLYITVFTEDEVTTLSSFNRYLGTYLLAIYLALLYALLFVPAEKERTPLLWCILAAALLLPHTTAENTFLTAFDAKYMARQKEIYEEQQVFRDHLLPLKQYVQENERLLIYNGDQRYSNYVLTPISADGIGDTYYEWLVNYGEYYKIAYVYFDTVRGSVETPEFISRYGDLFEGGPDMVMDGGLYQMSYRDGTPHFTFVAKIE